MSLCYSVFKSVSCPYVTLSLKHVSPVLFHCEDHAAHIDRVLTILVHRNLFTIEVRHISQRLEERMAVSTEHQIDATRMADNHLVTHTLLFPSKMRDQDHQVTFLPVQFISRSPLKPEPETVSEEFDVRQCKMVLTLKTPSEDIYAMKLLSIILGETATSKLFRNVREKLSLCYYCSCSVSMTKGTLIIDSGVERSNIEKAKAEILAQLDEVCRGEITDEEINSALLYTDNALCQIGDTMSSYSGWYFERLCDGEVLTPQEIFSRYSSVTRERLTEAAKSLKLDSVYLMLDKEAK